VAGLWRHRSQHRRLTITLGPLTQEGTAPSRALQAIAAAPTVQADAETIAACWGAADVEVAAIRA
jgi:hypothetical protein